MKNFKRQITFCLAVALAISLFAGCGNKTIKEVQTALSETPEIGSEPGVENPDVPQATVELMALDTVPLAAGTAAYEMPEAKASGTLTQSNTKASLDYSNTTDGYVMVKYLGSNAKVKTLITGPSGVSYQYLQSLSGDYDVFPLSDGNGTYKIGVYENVSGDSYSTSFSQTITVTMKDEFAPFLRPNKFVNFKSTGTAATKAAELTKDISITTDKIRTIYEYVVQNVSYDYEQAKTVKKGYFPDVEAVFASKKGICFDYAALMTAMLRSQGVPTKLVVGYSGKLYHAWINTYSEKEGWVEASIYFDGKQWKLMDPTFASNGKSSKEIMAYIGKGTNYTASYLY